MTDCVWEPLAEIEFHIDSDKFQVYCLFSRAFVRTKTKSNFQDNCTFGIDHWEDKGSLIDLIDAQNSDANFEAVMNEKYNKVKSLDSNITDFTGNDFDSVLVNSNKNNDLPFPGIISNCVNYGQVSELKLKLNNMNSKHGTFGADSLEEPNICIEWEKFWFKNGKTIIWRSWIEKFGPYINPNFLKENFLETLLLNDITNNGIGELYNEIDYTSLENFKCINVNEDENKFPSEIIDSQGLSTNSAENVVSEASTESSLDNATNSSLNLIKTTSPDSDLKYAFKKAENDFLSSSFNNDNCQLLSTSDGTIKENLGEEIDNWWKRVWNEHYLDQYNLSFHKFLKDYVKETVNEQEVSLKNNEINFRKTSGIINKKDDIDNGKQKTVLQSKPYLNSISYCLQRLEKLNNLSKENEENDSLKEIWPSDNNWIGGLQRTANSSELSEFKEIELRNTETKFENFKSTRELQNKDQKEKYIDTEIPLLKKKDSFCRKWNDIRRALTLMGFSFNEKSETIYSGFVTYRKKNIRRQNRRLKLSDEKSKIHVFFDDDGNILESRNRSPCSNDISTSIEETEVKNDNKEIETHSSLEETNYVDDEIKKIKIPRKKRRQCKKNDRLPREIMENKNLLKYWLKRYQLFSLFDQGIQLDTESWFSVTPEKLAKHHAERCRCDVLIDAFCGAGGNSIQFAFTCEKVIAIDIDPKKIEMAQHNARVYGVEERIEFIIGDFIKLACNLRADVVFLSPPWGGPEYNSQSTYNLSSILPPLGGQGLFRLATQVANDIAFFLPKNANSTDLAMLAGPGGKVEIEQNFMNRRLRSLTAYFGGLIMDPDDPII